MSRPRVNVVPVESRIEQVTVYENGARVRRVASLRAPLPSVVRFDDKGLVSWAVELPPLGRGVVTLEYKVKSQRGIATV